MNVRILGTSAAEGIPALFCDCEACERARRLGGREVRTRFQALVDDRVLVDLPPDTYHHMLVNGLRFSRVTDLLVTHSHQDHFVPSELLWWMPPFAHRRDDQERPLRVHGNAAVLRAANERTGARLGDLIEWIEARPFERFRAGDVEVLPLKAGHDPNETCLFYRLERGGSSFLLANDTGDFPEETWDALAACPPLSGASFDCTNCGQPHRRGHMNFDAVVDAASRMRERGMLREGARLFVHHFSHNVVLPHEELAARMAPHGIGVAFDGIAIEV